MVAMGRITSKNRGKAKNVSIQKAVLEAPESIISSKNFKDWVSKISDVRIVVITKIVRDKFFKT
jgi:hypothetical protein